MSVPQKKSSWTDGEENFLPCAHILSAKHRKEFRCAHQLCFATKKLSARQQRCQTSRSLFGSSQPDARSAAQAGCRNKKTSAQGVLLQLQEGCAFQVAGDDDAAASLVSGHRVEGVAHTRSCAPGIPLSEVCAYLNSRCALTSIQGVRTSQLKVCAHLKPRCPHTFFCPLRIAYKMLIYNKRAERRQSAHHFTSRTICRSAASGSSPCAVRAWFKYAKAKA